MRRFTRPFFCFCALTMFVTTAGRARSLEFTQQGIPQGFDALASSHDVMVDVYFGNQKIAETLAVAEPGLLKFRAPQEIITKLPEVIDGLALERALSGELPTNSSAACTKTKSTACGVLNPAVAAILYDEDRFRVDLFINPRLLRITTADQSGFLPPPSAPLSLTSAVGLAAAGTFGGSNYYNLQNRTVIALGNARLRTSNSFASKLGWVVDDFVAEVDRKELRYSAGMFWAPGDEFTGQRRIVGAGIGTQFDTWAGRDTLQGTPLVLFLARSARVELLVDGRLVSSRSYGAGNNELDTSALADGSYIVLMRIHEENGSVREEKRFFAKNAHIAPLGHPVYFAYFGLLANTRAYHPVSLSHTLYYQTGVAWRLNNSMALDGEILGTQRKAILEAGGSLIRPFGKLRLAGILSTSGDKGALVQLASGGCGLFNFNFDLRRVWSGDGNPLIPLPRFIDTFDTTAPTGVQLASGSYTQVVGSVGLRLANGYLSLVGTYRKDRTSGTDYSIGPSLSMPLVNRNGLQVLFDASAQRTRTTSAGFAGVRILYTSGGLSLMSTAGQSVQDDRSKSRGTRSQLTGSLDAQYSRETAAGTILSGEIGADRNIDSSTVHADGTMTSRFGNARADIIHNLDDDGRTQYDLSFQSGIALSLRGSTIGARQVEQSALIVSVGGDARETTFNVLVNDIPRGRVRIGQPFSLFVPAYRTYRVRIMPADAAAVEYDASPREVTLYPGNVQALKWDARSYFTLIARAVTASGSPIANAIVESRKGIAETDSYGYFQIDMSHGDPITIAQPGGTSCNVKVPDVTIHDDYASIGKVLCQ